MQQKIGMGIGVFLLLLMVAALSFGAITKANPVYAIPKTQAEIDKAEAAAKAKLEAERKAKAQYNKEQKQLIDLLLKNKKQKDLLKNYHDKTTKEYKELEAQRLFLIEQEKMLQEGIDAAKADYNKKRALLLERIRVMYENSSFSSLQTVLESKGIVDFIYRLQLVQSIVSYDNKLMDEVLTAKDDMNKKLQIKEDLRIQTQKESADKMKYIKQLDKSSQVLVTEITENTTKLNFFKQQEDQSDAESKNLEAELKNLAAASKKLQEQLQEQQRTPLPTDGGTTSHTSGRFIWPVPGGTHELGVGSTFGMRMHPIYHDWRMHYGVDIHASLGTTIVAVEAGTVYSASYRGGYGNCVMIDHGNGIITLYAHCSQLLVSAGESVQQGQAIARAGSTGASTGSHLHFEVRVNGTPVDPMNGYIG